MVKGKGEGFLQPWSRLSVGKREGKEPFQSIQHACENIQDFTISGNHSFRPRTA